MTTQAELKTRLEEQYKYMEIDQLERNMTALDIMIKKHEYPCDLIRTRLDMQRAYNIKVWVEGRR